MLSEMLAHLVDIKAIAARSKVLHKLGYHGIAEQLNSVEEKLIEGGADDSSGVILKVLEVFNDDLNSSLTEFAEHTNLVLGYMDKTVEKLTK